MGLSIGAGAGPPRPLAAAAVAAAVAPPKGRAMVVASSKGEHTQALSGVSFVRSFFMYFFMLVGPTFRFFPFYVSLLLLRFSFSWFSCRFISVFFLF